MVAFFSLKPFLVALLLLLVIGYAIFTMQGLLPINLDGLAKFDKPSAVIETTTTNIGNIKLTDDSAPQPNKMADPVNIKDVDLRAESLPEILNSHAGKVKITPKRIKILDRDTFYREALPPEGVSPTNQNAVLLHGMSFKSQTWEELGTIGLLAAMGHRVVAFDLPGYGETAGSHLDEAKKGEFLNEALDSLKLSSAVVVSPSMSGSYALPFLFNFPGKMSGYVPVAPIATDKYGKEEYESVKTPTLIICGELDENIGKISTQNLQNLPNSQLQILPKARHPAYLDQPHLFHQLLFNFFAKLRKN